MPVETPAPTVSVIMIFLNERRYLQEAIDSVLRQSFGAWELLLIDDGSSDGSSDIAARNATRWPGRIRHLSHPGHENRGMSASRNLGLREAKGRYVAFLDGDDVYHPLRLESHVRAFENVPDVSVVQSDIIHWASWLGEVGRVAEDYVRPSICLFDRILRAPLALHTLVAVPEFSVGICSFTVRRDFALAVGGFEDQFRSLYEDQVFQTKIYANGDVYVIEDYLARYRMHPASTVARLRRSSGKQTSPWYRETRAYQEWRESYLRSLHDRTGRLGAVLQELEHRSQAGESRRFVQTRVKALLRGLVEALPTRVQQRFLLFRRQRSYIKTLQQYETLCDRALQGGAVTSAGRDGA